MLTLRQINLNLVQNRTGSASLSQIHVCKHGSNYILIFHFCINFKAELRKTIVSQLTQQSKDGELQRRLFPYESLDATLLFLFTSGNAID